MNVRIGLGYDIHRLKKGTPLWLGGIQIPYESGLEGHSDGDALLHAITDAILGAAALPDIGHFFPPTDPKIKGISSAVMLARASEEAKKAGFKIGNIDSVIIAEAPKIAPYRETICQRIAEILKLQVSQVQVKGKTNEGLGEIGQKEAIAAQAVVLLQK